MTAGTTTTTAADGAGRTFSITTTVANKTVVSGKTTIKSITIQVAPVTTIGSLNSTTLDYYGSVKLYTERSNPVVGTNLN
jgi:hypothetical protein